jgi:hypothetical protein
MNIGFRVFASYNILQYLCDFIHVLIFVIVSKCRKKSQINEYSDNEEEISWQLKKTIGYWPVQIHGNKFATGQILKNR